MMPNPAFEPTRNGWGRKAPISFWAFRPQQPLPKKTSADVNDPDYPAWTEDMLGAPEIKRGRGPQAAPTKSSPLFAWMKIFWSSSSLRRLATSHG